MHIKRRNLLMGLATYLTMGNLSISFAGQGYGDKRLVVILLRGALDGLSAIQPYGDNKLLSLRKELSLPEPGMDNGLLDLGGFFGLHPSMPCSYELYKNGCFLPIHGVAAEYRIRSHFEAQDLLESGDDHVLNNGWLNRVTHIMNQYKNKNGIAIGNGIPLLMQGQAKIESYVPAGIQHPDNILYNTIISLNKSDKLYTDALSDGLSDRKTEHEMLKDKKDKPKGDFNNLCSIAGQMLKEDNGPRICSLEIGGWDTHTAQIKRLADVLKKLDDGIGILKDNLQDKFNDTVVIAITEFGRTVRVNGTDGTDHGTGTTAFVYGGNIDGGKVKADWVGLNNLFENRDLMPTTDLMVVIRGILKTHLGFSDTECKYVFPDIKNNDDYKILKT